MKQFLQLLRPLWLKLFKLYAPASKKAARRASAMHLFLAAVLALSAASEIGREAAAAPPPGTGGRIDTLPVSDVETLLRLTPLLRPGSTILLQPGQYVIDRLALPASTTLHAPKGASIVGGVVVVGSGSLVRGVTFTASTVDLSGSLRATVAECTFNDTETAIKIDGATGALIVNNDFNRVRGAAVTGWGLDRSTISGNHFREFGQGLNLQFNNERQRGRDILVERNVFSGATRMPIEVGPLGAFTENLVVRQNWADQFRNRGPDPGQTMSTFVAYSIVPTHGVNSTIVDNYANAGAPPRGGIGIELDGSGEISRNIIDDFNYGAIVYGSGFKVQLNAFLSTSFAQVLNYSKRSGVIELQPAWNGTPRRPDRATWRP